VPTAPIPIASYLASLTLNFYDLANVRATGDAVIQVAGGNGSVSIPIAQGVQGFSMYAGATLPTATSPAGAVPMDKYTLTGVDGAGLPGDVYRKNGDNTWALIGSIRGAAGHPMFVGTTVPTTTVPAGAVTGDQFLFLGVTGGTPGDVYVKASDGSWSVSGSQRGAAGPSGAAQMQDRGNWAATTAYVSGDVVTQGGLRWLTKAAHTSGATFSGATNWLVLGGVAAGGRSLARRTTDAVSTAAATPASAQRVLSLTGIPVTGGRTYKVSVPVMGIYSTGSGTFGTTVGQAFLTYTTDGTTPGASSPQLTQITTLPNVNGQAQSTPIECTYTPSATGTLGVLLAYFQPVAGGSLGVTMAASTTQPIELIVEDIGVPATSTSVAY